jgi:LPPG:FO 2-phospho-L-lactate transferase
VTAVAVLCGGVGAARLLRGLVQVVPAEELTAIVNVGDDLELHGLHVSPDLDTVTYTVAGAVSSERGWGLEGETWQAMAMVERYGGESWFSLGDRDLGTHLYRTHRLTQGATLSTVTGEIASAWSLPLRLVPVTDDRLRTHVTTDDEGEITFQEYFVRRRHDVAVTSVRFDGAEGARPAPGVIEALEAADVIVIAPSNPLVSIAPVLAVSAVRAVLERRRERVVAVSPLVGGRALKGPADRLLAELDHEPGVAGVAAYYRAVAATLVIDDADAELAPVVGDRGLRPVVGPTVMSGPAEARALAALTLAAVAGGGG